MKKYILMQVNEKTGKGLKGRFYDHGYSNNGIIIFTHIKYEKQMKPGIVEVSEIVEKNNGKTTYGFVKGVNVKADKKIDIDGLSIENLLSLTGTGRIKYLAALEDGTECIVLGNSDPISGIEYLAFMLNGEFIFVRKFSTVSLKFIKQMTAFNREILPKKFITNIAISKYSIYNIEDLELNTFPVILNNLHKIVWKKINGYNKINNGFIALYGVCPEDVKYDSKLYDEILAYNDSSLQLFKQNVNIFNEEEYSKVKLSLKFYGLNL